MEPRALDWLDFHWMSKNVQQSASYSARRDESQTPSVHTSRDRWQSTLKEDTDIMHLLSLGVKISPNLATRVAENLKENLRRVRFEELPDQHCNEVYLRARLHVGITADEPNG